MLDRWSITVSDEEKDKSEPLIRWNKTSNALEQNPHHITLPGANLTSNSPHVTWFEPVTPSHLTWVHQTSQAARCNHLIWIQHNLTLLLPLLSPHLIWKHTRSWHHIISHNLTLFLKVHIITVVVKQLGKAFAELFWKLSADTFWMRQDWLWYFDQGQRQGAVQYHQQLLFHWSGKSYCCLIEVKTE